MYRECRRVLRPGGVLSCYDWMKWDGELSVDMDYWFELEGLTYALRSLEEHRALLREAGFVVVELRDRSEWYRAEARREHERLRNALRPELEQLLGEDETAHFIEAWRALTVICDKGELRQVYSRAEKAPAA